MAKPLLTIKKTVAEVVVAVLLIVASIWVVQKLEDHYAFLDWRYWAHQRLHKFSAQMRGTQPYDRNTIIVLIGDDDFWRGDYAGRLPLNKKKLSELLLALDRLEPKVVALDLNFSSPTQDGSVIENDIYRQETAAFATAVKTVSRNRSVVLTKVLLVTPDAYVALPNRFDDFKTEMEKARFGYITLPFDYRLIPLSVVTKDQTPLDSFSEAIVRAFDLTGEALRIDQQDSQNVVCGPYLEKDKFVTFDSHKIMAADADKSRREELKPKFSGKIVIVGGGWTVSAAGNSGSKIDPADLTDSRYTPAGTMPAVFLHANWVESILTSGGTGKELSDATRWVIEFSLGLLGFFVVRGWLPWLRNSPRLLIVCQIMFVPILFLFWLVMSYLFFQNFGLFVDPFAGFVGAIWALGENVTEKVMAWRGAALAAT
jgi:CHASE2 domain-containing sensor protein